MIIEIAGNVASGKSFLGRMLAEKLGCELVGIDDFRERGMMESAARVALANKVLGSELIVYETTTMNKVHKLIQAEYEKQHRRVLKVLVWTDEKVCLERYKKRDSLKGFDFGYDIERSMKYIFDGLKRYKPDVIVTGEAWGDEFVEIILKEIR